MSQPLHRALTLKGLAPTRSQSENYIRLGMVQVNGKIVSDPSSLVEGAAAIKMRAPKYVSRGGLKLASVASNLKLNFRNKVVLDVGSSTGGFSDYSLSNGAQKVVAVDSGTDQLHPSLRANHRVEVHEKTDIRHFKADEAFDMVLIDVSFISLREILPAIAALASAHTDIIAMVKPQFETENTSVMHKGVIKNDRLRRDILKEFEGWLQPRFAILRKADSLVRGTTGNRERFYVLRHIDGEQGRGIKEARMLVK